jgi:ATP-dependent Lon protease
MKNISLPVIALRSMTVLPDMVIHFDISRKKSIHAVEKSMEDDQKVFLATQLDPENADPGIDDLFEIGTVAKIKQLIKLPNGVVRVLVEGMRRGTVASSIEDDKMLQADITLDDMSLAEPEELVSKAMITGMHELIRQYAVANPKMSKDIVKQWLELRTAKELLSRFIIDYPMEYLKRQEFLEMNDLDEIYTSAAKLLIEDTNVCRIRDELAEKVRSRVDANQKEYILKEQLKVLGEELNGDDAQSEISEFTEAVEKLNATEEVKDKINKEIRRYKLLTQGSSEAGVERGYIETLLSLPWDNASTDNQNLKEAEEILNHEHYGMEKVKERILESLAVRTVTNQGDAPILCLVGPPGTGKTSIARSVAKALNKEYVRICLGGVRDEAEIRGHRKTYVGAMPGRIANGFREAGVKNPLVLLDEIDKISSDYKGDTASALLEVLDSEQNAHFVDHYVEIPMDLSQALFIATANDLSEMSRPLLDRMEIIEVSSYTKNEKMHIAKEHLIPKQIKKNGLNSKQIHFSDKAIDAIIEGYTREAGVRSLERKIAAICRKVVKQRYDQAILDVSGKPIKITDKNITDYLGCIKFDKEKVHKKNQTGIVCGLAWTSVGGETLEIEVNTMPGKGELILTGQMGDVMQESARIALSYVRSIAGKKIYNISKNFFDNHNIHLHIPEGAVPKDGPSAGVTMATALLSAIAKIPVRADIAMTGEITLRGRVLPVGGLKEKLLAANTAGIKTVFVPEKNKRDILELSNEIVDPLEIVYVSEMNQILKQAIIEK